MENSTKPRGLGHGHNSDTRSSTLGLRRRGTLPRIGDVIVLDHLVQGRAADPDLLGERDDVVLLRKPKTLDDLLDGNGGFAP